MTGWKAAVRVAAISAGVVVICACLVNLYMIFRLPLEVRPWNWKLLDLTLAVSAAVVGAACLSAGITGKGRHIENLFHRFDKAREASALREVQGFARQRQALERPREAALEGGRAE